MCFVLLQEVARLKGVQLADEVTTNLRGNDLALGNLAKNAATFPLSSPVAPPHQQQQQQQGEGEGRGMHGIRYLNGSGIQVSLDRRPQTKSRGYWLSLENVKKELVAWSEEHERPAGVMPIIEDIRKTGNYMLFHAITKYVGLHSPL